MEISTAVCRQSRTGAQLSSFFPVTSIKVDSSASGLEFCWMVGNTNLQEKEMQLWKSLVAKVAKNKLDRPLWKGKKLEGTRTSSCFVLVLGHCGSEMLHDALIAGSSVRYAVTQHLPTLILRYHVKLEDACQLLVLLKFLTCFKNINYCQTSIVHFKAH